MLPTPYKDIDHAEVTFAQYHNDVAGLVLRANIGTFIHTYSYFLQKCIFASASFLMISQPTKSTF